MGSLVAEAGVLLALARDPFVLVLMPALALLTLVPILFVGRVRLPDEECENDPDFAGQAAILATCFATHTYDPPGRGEETRFDVPLKIEFRRRFRGVRSRAKFVVVRDAEVFLILTARSYWLWYARKMRFGDVGTLGISMIVWTREVDVTRMDDEILGKTYLHATKTGERDRRFRDNPAIYEVRRHSVELTFDGLDWQIELYSADNASLFANALSAICGQGPALVYSDDDDCDASDEEDADDDQPEEIDDDADEELVREWHDVLGTPADAPVNVIREAYRKRLKEYHPDRVAHLGEKLRALANEEALAINQAYAEAMRQHS